MDMNFTDLISDYILDNDNVISDIFEKLDDKDNLADFLYNYFSDMWFNENKQDSNPLFDEMVTMVLESVNWETIADDVLESIEFTEDVDEDEEE